MSLFGEKSPKAAILNLILGKVLESGWDLYWIADFKAGKVGILLLFSLIIEGFTKISNTNMKMKMTNP